jgi:HAMP domain-containing protein
MSTPTPRTRPRVFSLGSKLVIAFTFTFTILFVGAFYWFYVFSTERAIARILDDLEATVAGAAAGLDGASLARLFVEGEPDDTGGSAHADYGAQLQWLQTVQSLEPRAWPFTYVAGAESNEIVALVDLWILSNPSKAYAFGETDIGDGSLTAGLSGLTINLPRDRRCQAAREAIPDQPLARLRGEVRFITCRLLHRVGYTDAHGSWVSAHAPVRDAEGNLRGAVGLDFELAHVDEVQDAILGSTGRAFLIAYAVLLLLVLVLSRVLTRPIVRLTAAAERVGEGRYDEDFGPLMQRRFRDEIGVLADVFVHMTEKIGVRERTLRREVHELRIVIDEGKRAKEVQEIVETDFFRDLQARAHQMRRRQAKADEATI